VAHKWAKACQELVANAKGAVWSSVPSRKGYSKVSYSRHHGRAYQVNFGASILSSHQLKGFISGLEHRNRQKG
jgi:hypothetical protein